MREGANRENKARWRKEVREEEARRKMWKDVQHFLDVIKHLFNIYLCYIQMKASVGAS